MLKCPCHRRRDQVGFVVLETLKAPGVDGLHAGFFQYFWADVKGSVCREVMGFLKLKLVPSLLNETMISLIPKCPNPENFNNYRPISLCNTIYKVITKS